MINAYTNTIINNQHLKQFLITTIRKCYLLVKINDYYYT